MSTEAMVSEGPRIEVTMLALTDLVPAEVNPRRGHVESIRESLREHGQFAPILVQRSSMQIIKGNHTYKAMMLEGFTDAQCTLIDCTDDEAQRILLVDNRTSDKGGYDSTELAALLDTIASTAKGFAGTGWDPDEYDDLLASLDAMPVMDEQDTDAGWAYDDDTLARRTAQRQASMGDTALNEVTLYFKPDDYEQWRTHLATVQTQLGGVPSALAALAAVRSYATTKGYGPDGVEADTFIAGPDGDALGEHA